MYKLIFIFLFTFFKHPIHLAVTEINVTKTRSLEISHKIFYDDLESTIARLYKVKLALNTPKQHPKTDEYLQRYLAEHFKMVCNGQVQPLTYVGHEFEEEAIWIYYESPSIAATGELHVTDRLLMEFHNDQNNFMHFQQGDTRKSLRFNYDNQLQSLEY